MIEKLDSIDGLTEILSTDKVANLFFINDLALFGTGDVAVYRIGEGLIALNYRNDGLCLYAYGPYNEDEALTFLAREKWSTVMGPAATMDAFLPYFKDESSWSVLRRRMLCLEKAHFSPVARKGDRKEESVIRRLSTPDDFLQMLELYERIEAFSHRRKTDRSELVEEAKELAQRDDGLYYATFVDGQAVSSAGLSGIANRSAMVVGVCTLPEYEGHLHATSTLSAVLDYGFSTLGLDYVCLWHSSARAKAVYERLGFTESSSFTSVSRLPGAVLDSDA